MKLKKYNLVSRFDFSLVSCSLSDKKRRERETAKERGGEGRQGWRDRERKKEEKIKNPKNITQYNNACKKNHDNTE